MKAFAAGTFNPDGNIYIFTTSGLQPFGLGDKEKQTYVFNADQFLVQDGCKHSRSTWMSRFIIDNIKKIDSGEFLAQFVYFEAVTLHLLSLKEAQNIEQYFRLQQSMGGVSLYERIKLLINHYIVDDQSKRDLKKLLNILEIRNQVAHVLKPSFIKFESIYSANDDPALVNKITSIMWSAMGTLVNEYEQEQNKMSDWINKINANTPDYVEIKNAAGQVIASIGDHSDKRGVPLEDIINKGMQQ